MHVIVEGPDPAAAVAAVRAVCMLIEAGGHGPCRPTVEVRQVLHQGRLL